MTNSISTSSRKLWQGSALLLLLAGSAVASTVQQDWDAHKRGNVDGTRRIAYRYYKGNGLKTNLSAAVKWFRQAADKGDVQSMVMMGDFYSKGEGVKKDIATAKSFYEKAAAKGSEKAEKRLAAMREYRTDSEVKANTDDSSNRKIAGGAKEAEAYVAKQDANRKIAGGAKIGKLLQEIDELVKTQQPNGENMGRAIGNFYSAVGENEDKAIAWLRARPKVKRSVPLLLELYSGVIKDNRIGEEDVDVMLYAFDVGMTDTSVHKLLRYPEDAFDKLESMIKKSYFIDGDKALAALDAHPGEKADEILIKLLHGSGPSREKAQKDVNVHLRYASIKFAKNSKSDCAYAYRDAYKLDPAKTIEALKKLPLENKITLEAWENLVGEKSMEAALYLGVAYMKGASGLEVDRIRAERYFDRALDFGSNSQIEALPIEQTLPFWEYLAGKKKNQYAALRLAELYLAGGDGIQADEKEAQGYFYWAYMGRAEEAEAYVAKQDAVNAEKLNPALKAVQLQSEQRKLLHERASMVDKSLPNGALCGDYFEFVSKNFARAKQYHCMPTQRGGEYASERMLMNENTPMIAYVEEVKKNSSGIYLLYYLATKYEKTLDAGNIDKIEAIYKGIQEIGLECSKVDRELRRYDKEARELGKKIFGSDMQSDGVKTEALKYSWPLYALTVLLYTREGCNILYRKGVGEMLEKSLSAKYGKHAVEWNFKWKICSLIDVFGGDVKLLVELPRLSDREYEAYRSKLLTALNVKYQSSPAFREHVSETLDMLRAKDGEDMLIVDKYITHMKRAHFINYMVPSLGQMCGIDL